MLRFLDRLEEWIIATLIATATSIIFMAVLHRYFAGISVGLAKSAAANGMPGLAAFLQGVFRWLTSWDVSWVQEVCIYMFVWMAKFGAAYGVRTGIHVGVDVFVNMLGPKYRHRIVLFGLLCGATFTGIVGSLGANFVYHIFQTGQQSNDLEMPMWIVYLAVPLGSYLMCFRFLQVAWHFAKTGDLPKHDESHVEGLEDVKIAESKP
ncbi:MAG: TRAP transporter small permease [Hyphomicrobiaceae bacterium]